MNVEEKLDARGLELPEPLLPLGNYVGAVKTGNLLVEICGEPGRHARSAVGVQSLPTGIPVKIEVVFEVDE